MTDAKKVLYWGLGFLLISTFAYDLNEALGSDEWEIQVTPYFWAPAVDADTTVSGQTAPLDLSFSDILDNFDVFGLSGRVEAWRGKLGFIFDGMYVDLDGDFSLQTPGPSTPKVGVDIKQTMVDLAVSYRFVETPQVWFEPIVGVRYTELTQEITLSEIYAPVGPVGTILGGTEDWLEPFIGARAVFHLTEKWQILLRGDVGGFGIGDASDLTWNFLAGLGFRPWQRVSFKLGYRVYSLDYETGSGSDKFGFDGTLDGPQIGVTIHF